MENETSARREAFEAWYKAFDEEEIETGVYTSPDTNRFYKTFEAGYEAALAKTKYLVWSNEHNSWWRANHQGYTDHAHLAGRYSKEEALQICNGANYGWDTDRTTNIPDELPIEESIAMGLEYKIFGDAYKNPDNGK